MQSRKKRKSELTYVYGRAVEEQNRTEEGEKNNKQMKVEAEARERACYREDGGEKGRSLERPEAKEKKYPVIACMAFTQHSIASNFQSANRVKPST